MPRSTVTFTISLPPAMAAELEDLQQKQHMTRSELIREAVRCYVLSLSVSKPGCRLVP